MEGSLYLLLALGFFVGFAVTAAAIIWAYRQRAQRACTSHAWEGGADGRLRCARCGMIAGERD